MLLCWEWNHSCLSNSLSSHLFCLSFVSLSVPENGIIKSDKVYEVMLATDRGHFSRCNPYMDSPQSIGRFPLKPKPCRPFWLLYKTEYFIQNITTPHTLPWQSCVISLPLVVPIGYQATISAPHMVRSQSCSCGIGFCLFVCLSNVFLCVKLYKNNNIVAIVRFLIMWILVMKSRLYLAENCCLQS